MKKKILYCVFISAFFLACIIPSAGMLIFGESEAAANEILASRPSVHAEDGTFNRNITGDITDYFADRFAFRQQFITAYAKIHSAVFGESSSPDVILGKEGWLFYNSTRNDFLHAETLPQYSINSIARTVKMMQDYAEGMNVNFAFTIAPNKSTVYPDYMPDIGHVYDRPGNLENLASALKAQDVSYADLSAGLKNAAGTGNDSFNGDSKYLQDVISGSYEDMHPIYHRLDSHWNNRGAALGLRIITDKLGTEAWDWFNESYDIQKSHKGDLYEMLYPAGKELDDNMKFHKAFSFSYDQEHNGNIPAVDNIKIHTHNSDADTGNLLMFRDSFGNALYPFMADSFTEAVFSRMMPYRMDWLGNMDIDHLVIEIVERNIVNLLNRAPVMPAPEITQEEFEAAGGSRDAAAESSGISAASSESAELTGYTAVSGYYDIADENEDARIFISADGRIFEAFPAGSPDPDGSVDGRFTALIPSDVLNGNSISVILCRGGFKNLEVTI